MDEPRHTSFQASEGFYQHLFDSSPDVMMMVNRQGEIQIANSRCEDVLGYAYGDMQGGQMQALLAEDSAQAFEVMLTGIREGTAMPEVEVVVRTHAGIFVPMMLDIREIEEEETGHYLVRLRDLREIKALEQEYRNLFESIGNAVFIGDPDSGEVYQANRQACALTGFTLGELMGSDYDLVHSEAWQEIVAQMEQAGGEELSGYEMVIRGKAGAEVPVEIHLKVVSRGEDRIFIETAIDISARKALEARMKDLRGEWDSFIRHELRNPLTPILAFSQILVEDFPEIRSNDKVLQYMEAIWQGGKRLERLLDLTWEVQAYEQGQVLLNKTSGDLYETLRSAISDAVLGISEADAVDRVTLVPNDADGDPPERVLFCDGQKLQRAFTNLIKNALEHDPGAVTVRVEGGDDDEVRVSIHNGGEPIPPDRLQTIFEKFNTTKRDRKGTGLGTTIAKMFIEAQGGRLEVTSSREAGTMFTATVPGQVEGEAKG